MFLDGIVGTWFLKYFENAVREGNAQHYVILRADKGETLRRAFCGNKLDGKRQR